MKFNTELFNISNLRERKEMVELYGTFVTSIKYYAFNVALYRIKDKLIEVFVSIQDDTLHYIEFFDMNESRINLYSSSADISNLIKK